MKRVDEDHHQTSNPDHGWASFWEYGLIVAGLAIVITFGTHSLSRNMKDSVARSSIDQTTTASIGAKKPIFGSSDRGDVQVSRP